jgi:hypothetical protein
MATVAHSPTRFNRLVEDSTFNLRNFVRIELPTLNTAVELKRSPMGVLVVQALPVVTDAVAEARSRIGRIDRGAALEYLQLLGFVLSSVERHSQAAGSKPGEGKAQLGLLDDLLIDLGRVAQHPPRDTDTTYWYRNRQALLSFTGDAQEAHFNFIVNLQREVQSAACRLLRPICLQEMSVSSPEAADALRRAADGLERMVDGYRSFTEPGPDGTPRFSPGFFMRSMRTYLVTYPVGDETWAGPNAANLVANMMLDYMAGVTEPWYAEVVQTRWRYLTRADQIELEAEMKCVSLTERVIHALGFDASQILSTETETLARCIAASTVNVKQVLCAYYLLMAPITQGAGVHFRLIKDYLIRNSASLTPAEQKSLPVNPGHGTGGMDHDKTRAIMQMRQKHPVVSKLIAAIRLALPEARQMHAESHEGGVPHV